MKNKNICFAICLHAIYKILLNHFYTNLTADFNFTLARVRHY